MVAYPAAYDTMWVQWYLHRFAGDDPFRTRPGSTMSDSSACATLAAAFDDVGTGYLVVVTGAGVSLASGIPTFRGTDPGAVWKRDVTELGTNRYFEEDPAGIWSWYTSRFDIVLDKQPNPAHRALAAIERWQVARGGRFLLVTQNVDPLHERAGSERLVKVHGSADRVRCSRHRCVHGAPHGSWSQVPGTRATLWRDDCGRTWNWMTVRFRP